MNTLAIVQNDLTVLETIAKTAFRSGLYNGVGGVEKILMVLLAANDLGIKPTIALNGGLWNIQGKIEISARLMTSMIRKAGHSISIKECNDKICTIKGKRADNGDELEASFSWEDAQKAGLAGRDVWKKYTEDMLYSRAMSRLARRLFPDVIGTSYVEGEIRDAEVVDVTPEVEKNENLSHSEISEVQTITKEQAEYLEGLLAKCSQKYQGTFRKGLAKLKINLDSLAKDKFEATEQALLAKAKECQDEFDQS